MKIFSLLPTLFFGGCLIFTSLHYYSELTKKDKQIQSITDEKNKAEFITQSHALTVSIFNAISGVTINEQQKNNTVSENRKVIIKTIIRKQACSRVAIPDAAADVLLKHYNALREGADNPYTGESH